MKWKIFSLLFIGLMIIYCGCKKVASCNSTTYWGAKVSSSTVSDFDGNIYHIVKIGNQNWLQQNLRSKHYQNGALIIQGGDSAFNADSLRGLDSATWFNIYNNNTTQAAWCYYNRDSAYDTIFGKLYNWYAVTSPNQLCPVGFHVPSDAEWHQLALTLDACAVVGDPESITAGGQLKAINIWLKLDTTASNASKFTAYPAGNCDASGTCYGLDSLSYFWTSSQDYGYSAWDRKLNMEDSSVGRFNGAFANGFSVRCVGN